MINLKPFLTALGLLLFLASAVIAQTPHYRVTDLGTLGGLISNAFAINNNGVVVGASQTAKKPMHTMSYGLETHAFLWKAGRMRDLGTLGGGYSEARGVNDAGAVVGFSDLPQTVAANPIFLRHAFLYSKGKMRDLGVLPGDAVSEASGISSEGQIVGVSGTGQTDNAGAVVENAVLWSEGEIRRIDPSGSLIAAYGINRYGQVAGKALINNFVPVLWNLFTKNDTDLSSGSNLGVARAINARGQVAGDRGSFEGPRHAFLSDADLPALPGYAASSAEAINNFGVVVGLCALTENARGYAEANHWTNNGDAVACLWAGNKVQDMNALIPSHSGWALVEATGINDRGWIVGNGIFHGMEHAFLLTPIAQ